LHDLGDLDFVSGVFQYIGYQFEVLSKEFNQDRKQSVMYYKTIFDNIYIPSFRFVVNSTLYFCQVTC